MAEEKQQYRADNYHESFDPSKLKNADLNISQYGDDSSMKNYNDPNRWGGENVKYEGEGTKNSQVAYNPNATVEGLDPNYKYGQEAQMANSAEANYIARRNDEIASALYNAGKTSQLDVADFLNSQQGFYNSNTEERHNTVQSIWKRLGQMAEQNNQSDANNTEPTNTPQDTNNEALSNMESDLNKSTAGELYGKVTAEEGNPENGIKTQEDANSVYRAMDAKRRQTLADLQAMDSEAIAAAIVGGQMASDTQAMRDLMQYNSAKYQEVKQAEKRLIGQMNINNITNGTGEWTTSATNGQSGISNEMADFALENANGSTSAAEILKSVSESLSSNVNAATAQEQMSSIEADMETLKNRMKNLKREASQVFKGDVPAYIVGAYISNRTMEIQDQLSILEGRYNAAQAREQKEFEKIKWMMDYDLKSQELELKKESFALEKYVKEQGIEIDWYELSKKYGNNAGSSNGINGNSVPISSVSREEISKAAKQLASQCTNGQLGKAQCAAGIQKYYLPNLGVNLGTLSKWSEKQGICNEDSSYSAQVGDLVVMESKSKPENGHIGVVVGFRGDKMVYMDWNGSLGADGNGTEEPALREISTKDSKIYGYYNPTKDQTSEGNVEFSPEYADIYGKYLQGKFAAGKQLETQAAAMGKTVQQLDAEAKAWKKSQNNSTDVSMRLDAIARLLNTGGDNRVSRIISDSSLAQTLFGNYEDFDSAYNYVRDNITFDKLIELKNNGATFGALSDNELRAIANAAQNLSKKMTDAEFKKQLTWIYNELLRGIGEDAMTTQQISNAFVSKKYTPSSISSQTAPTTTRTSGTPTTTRTSTNGASGLTAEEKARKMQGF